MLSKVLGHLLLVGYAGAFLVVFVVSSYLSFSTFVRRGEMTVPTLRGLTLMEATSLLAKDGVRLRWREERDRFDPNVPSGGILEQSPKEASHIKKGAVVEVTLSRGRQLVEVPDLSGQALQTAQVHLKAAGLSLGSLVRVYSDGGEEERVVRQSPDPGRRVDPLSKVNLFLCLENSAQSFVMPDLVYQRYDQVQRFFEAHGFRVGSVKYEPYEGIEPGVVLRQFPLAGHRLVQPDVVSLVVASAEEGDLREGRR